MTNQQHCLVYFLLFSPPEKNYEFAMLFLPQLHLENGIDSNLKEGDPKGQQKVMCVQCKTLVLHEGTCNGVQSYIRAGVFKVCIYEFAAVTDKPSSFQARGNAFRVKEKERNREVG